MVGLLSILTDAHQLVFPKRSMCFLFHSVQANTLACNFLLALDQSGTGVSTTSLLSGFHSPGNILGARELMGVNDSEQGK